MDAKRTRRIGMAVVGLWMLAAATPAAAAEGSDVVCPVCMKASSEDATYGSKAGNTLIRGASNTLFGWTELIRQPGREARSGGNVFMGILRGMGQSVTRTMAGAGEVLTFWTPKIQNTYIHFANDCPLCARN
jgi:putative exosortase-associated protein (TIGR04073 family)